MKKLGIIGTPPNPFKKGGPVSSLDKRKRDGEQSQDTFIQRSSLPKPTTTKLDGKKK